MDRRKRTGMAFRCGLVLLLATTGCKSTQSKVPPGRSYSSDGKQAPAIGFSQEPHPANNAGNPAIGNSMLTPNGLGGAPGSIQQQPQFGTPSPAANNVMGVPGAGAFGAPGTSGAVPGTVPAVRDNPALTNPPIADPQSSYP